MPNPLLQRLGGARIFCVEWEPAFAFYAKTLELFVVDRNEERGHAVFQLAGQSLVLERVSSELAGAQGLVGRFTAISFETADIRQAHRSLAAGGVRFRSEPGELPGGDWSADFEDPAGNVLSLRQSASSPRTAEQQRSFETIRGEGRGGVGGPFVAWSQHPSLPRLIDAMGAYLLREGLLPARLRELAIITTGRIWTAQIEWYAHVPAARRAGISADIVEAIANRKPPDFVHADEAAVYRFAVEISETRSIAEDTYAAVVGELGIARSVELVALLGFYGMTAMALKTFQLRPPDDATRLLPE